LSCLATSLGAKPARFRKTRLLIVGCGDVGERVLGLMSKQIRCYVLTRSEDKIRPLRALGATPLLGNLDEPRTLARLAGLGDRLLHLAPPPQKGYSDTRTRALVKALMKRTKPLRVVYGSTSGVYGNCEGHWVNELHPLNAMTDRAKRRVDAETWIKAFGISLLGATGVAILRIPGIYALDREGGTPVERLQKGLPVLRPDEDVYTNHIHADDLALVCWRALFLGPRTRSYNINDDSVWLMGEYMRMAAEFFKLPPPVSMSREQVMARVTPMQWSFMQESRKMNNARMKKELGVRLKYPTPAWGWGGQSLR
jgi:nucleoside-diphosphate-sugar epimerase